MDTSGQEKRAQRLVRSLLLGSFIALLGHVAGTQYIAHELFYMEEFLGKPFAVDEAMGVKLFAPHKVYVWAHELMGRSVDEILSMGLAFALGSLVLAFVVGLLLFLFVSKKSTGRSHGTSRWATKKELDAAGWTRTPKQRMKRAAREGKSLGVSSSVVLGRSKKGKLYYDSSDEHVLVFAPTRAGKGVGLVIPTLLTWTGSVVVTDLKGECYAITSKWRKRFSHVIYLNPLDEHSACFNPLLEIERGKGAISGAKGVALILGTKPEGKFDPFWDAGAVELLTLTILYVLHVEDEKSLGRCAKLIKELDRTLDLMKSCVIEDEDVGEYIRLGAASIRDKSDNVREGWCGGALLALSLWSDPRVAENTSRSDFRLKDLQYSKSPTSLYLVIPPKDLATLSPFIRLFFQMMTDALTESLNEGVERHRLLMLMDEFPQFGKMEKVEQSIALTAGYGIKWFFITQGLDQLDRIYGRDNSFLAGCRTRIAFRCNDDKNAKRLSALIGKTTGEKQQEGSSGKRGLLARKDRKSVSTVQFERDLMTPGELQQLDSDRIVILSSGMMPALEWRVKYYEEEVFLFRTEGHTQRLPDEPLNDFPPPSCSNPWESVVIENVALARGDAPREVELAKSLHLIEHAKGGAHDIKDEPEAAATVALDKEQLEAVLSDRRREQPDEKRRAEKHHEEQRDEGEHGREDTSLPARTTEGAEVLLQRLKKEKDEVMKRELHDEPALFFEDDKTGRGR